MIEIDQATLDMAHEWVCLHHSDLEGEAFDEAVKEAAIDILEIEACETDRLRKLESINYE